MTRPATAPPSAGARRSPQSTSDAVVIADDLHRSFGKQEVIKGITLTIPTGSIIGLIGPSGCGKTTTVQMMAGLLEPTRGTASVFGTRSTRLSSVQRQRIGYLPQTPALFPDLSLWENLSFHASMYGLRLRRKQRLREVLDWVELTDHRKKRVRDVSGGMQRRLALASSFVHDPSVVFLDEPTAGIDPILRNKFWQQFRALRDEGVTMCVTTQYVGEAAYCDVVGMLSDGELVMLDTPDNLRRAAHGGEVVEIDLQRPVDDAELDAIAAIPGMSGRPQPVHPTKIRIVVDNADSAMGPLGEELQARNIPVVRIDEHFVDYDEAFVRLIERHRASAAASQEAAKDQG